MSYYPNTGSTYPYGAYAASGYPQTPGAYPTAAYQTGYPTAGYTSTWPYSYSYYPTQQPHQQNAAVASRSSTSTTPAPATPAAASSSTTTTNSTTAAVAASATAVTQAAPIQVAPQRSYASTSTFMYTPSLTRESVGAGSTSRSFRKQSSHRGLFTKEREFAPYPLYDAYR